MNEIINIYCDESCHLENDNEKTMGIGAVTCPAKHTQQVNHELKQIKKRHNMPGNFELKWTKTSQSKLKYYLEVIDYFSRRSFLGFRGYIVPDKAIIDHSKFPGQTHDQWYYKMFYRMLQPLVESPYHEYRIYIDIKDTHGYKKVNLLQDYLRTGSHDYEHKRITRMQEVRSDEVELVQLADFLLGATVYENRGNLANTGKCAVIADLKKKTGASLTDTTSRYAHKMNLYMWDGGQQ